MNRIRVWPHAILIILGVAIVAGAAVFFWKKYEPSAAAKGMPTAARIERVDGQVAINHSLDNTSNTQWIAANANSPISVGDRLYTRDNSRSEIAFTGRNFATVDANTSLDILDLSNQRTQIALREGSALFDVGSLSSGQVFEVATPCGAIDLQQPGTYRITIDNTGNATATAFSGQAQVVGQNGSGALNKGEVLTVPCGGSQGMISKVDYDQAGTYLDSYYRYRYPRTYDGRYRNYYTYLDDPYYYDPYRRYTGYHYVSDYVPGIYDLDDYGDWQYVNNYGYCWHPRVDSGWAPYESGYWTMDYPFGLTWISNEPWGYAPYHYGRWTYATNEWFWVPEPVNYYPTYAPALTAFFSFGNSSVGWVALGPGDPYNSWYYDPYWQPVYYSSVPTITRLVNVSMPNAVTVIPVQDFGQVIDPRIITRVDPQTIARSQVVLDPLTVDPLRKAAFSSRQAERRIDVPQTVVQQTFNKPVITAGAVPAPPFKRDLASALRVQQAPGRARSEKLQLNDQRAATAQAPGQPAQNLASEQARERQMADLARQAARGDRNARQQMQQLRQQQLAEQGGQRALNPAAQGERVAQPMQAQRDATREQMRAAQQLQRAAQQQQRLQNPRGRQQQFQGPPIRNAPQSQPAKPEAVRPQPQGRPPAEFHRPQSQPRIMAAPRQQPMPQARPQVERRGPPAQMRPQPQAAPRQQPMPQARPQVERRGPPVQMRTQPQAMPRPQPQAQPRPQMQRPQVQMQPRPQPQAQPRQQAVRPQPQPQSRPQGGPPQGAPAKGQGNPRKKPEKP